MKKRLLKLAVRAQAAIKFDGASDAKIQNKQQPFAAKAQL
jgi:hypothetical protein